MHKAYRESRARTQSAVDVLRANKRERVAERLKTGTYDVAPTPNITPVRTGFEGSVQVAKTAASRPKIDRRARDLSTARAALGGNLSLSAKPQGRRRASDDLLRGGPVEPKDAVTDDGENEGTDAGSRPSDAFSLIAGADRHERRKT